MAYKHLTFIQRCRIYGLWRARHSQTEIAKEIGVHKSTICREFQQNIFWWGNHIPQYRPHYAQSYTEDRHKRKPKQIKFNEEVEAFVREKVLEDWSPEQINGYAKRHNLFSISHCAWIFFGVNGGILLASAVSTFLSVILSHDALVAWGWRLAFLFSVFLMFAGIYFRSRIAETPIYLQLQQQRRTARMPLGQLLHAGELHRLFKAIGITWLFSVVISQVYLFTPTYLHRYLHFTMHYSLEINTIGLLMFTLLIPVMGYLSDKLGRKPLILFGALGYFFFSTLLYFWLIDSTFSLKIIIFFLFGIFSASIVGVVPSMLAELFPTTYRYSGVAISYNFSFGLFAGLTPMFVTYLLRVLHSPLALSINLMIGAIVTLITTLFTNETRQVDLANV